MDCIIIIKPKPKVPIPKYVAGVVDCECIKFLDISTTTTTTIAP